MFTSRRTFFSGAIAYKAEGNNMDQFSGIWFQRYRLVVISTWPESDLKRAALASAQAALEREVSFWQSRYATSWL